jgi:hypothetical protein
MVFVTPELLRLAARVQAPKRNLLEHFPTNLELGLWDCRMIVDLNADSSLQAYGSPPGLSGSINHLSRYNLNGVQLIMIVRYTNTATAISSCVFRRCGVSQIHMKDAEVAGTCTASIPGGPDPHSVINGATFPKRHAQRFLQYSPGHDSFVDNGKPFGGPRRFGVDAAERCPKSCVLCLWPWLSDGALVYTSMLFTCYVMDAHAFGSLARRNYCILQVKDLH